MINSEKNARIIVPLGGNILSSKHINEETGSGLNKEEKTSNTRTDTSQTNRN